MEFSPKAKTKGGRPGSRAPAAQKHNDLSPALPRRFKPCAQGGDIMTRCHNISACRKSLPPLGEGGALARRMRGKCPAGAPSSVTCGDSFPPRGSHICGFPVWFRVAANSRAGHAPPLQMTRKFRIAAMPRPYIARIPNVRAGRQNHFTPSARQNQGYRSYPAPAPACAKTSAYTRDNR